MDLLQNPIKVHIVSNNVIQTTYIFVGNVSSEILSALNKRSNKLEKFYGKNWKQKLGFEHSKEGGFEGGFEGESDNALENIEVDISDLESIKEDVDVFNNEGDVPVPEKPKIEPENVEKEPLEKIDDEIIDIDSVDIFGDSKIEEPTHGTEKIHISTMSIYPEDRISEFKEKIYTATGILPFKQHLYYISQKMSYPMSYQLVAESRIITDIRELDKGSEDQIEGLPIDPYVYKVRDSLKILSFDHFKTIGQLYDKHNQTTYYLVNMDDYINPVKAKLCETLKDRFQLEMLYYGFIVKYWPMLTIEAFPDLFITGLSEKYPDLVPSHQTLQKKYDVEQKTIDDLYSIKVVDNKMYKMSITSAILNIDVNRYGFKTKLNIRNIFDRIVLDEIVHHVKVLLYHHNKAFVLSKSYNGASHKYKLTHINSMLLFVSTSSGIESEKYIILQIYDNGKYQIRTTWGEELEMDFEKIHNIVKQYIDPIIDQINNMGMYVFSNSIRLRKPEKHLIQYTGLNMNIYWRKMIVPSDFKIVRETTNPLVQAGILQPRPSNVSTLLEFHFMKGITEYDIRNLERTHDLKNYYSYLTDSKIKQRWVYLFTKGRLMKITHRTSDIKIEIQGVREKEFDVVFDYITRMMMGINDKFSKPSSERAVKKKLNALKEMDPEAYDFRRNDNAMVYSRLCQHKDQPLMYSKEEFEKMNSQDKKKLFEYWNFTRNEKAFFACPDVKKPYISFIVNKHPRDYCLICCKITPSDPEIVRNPNIKKTQIYNSCKEDHVYSGNKIIRQKSKYIMTYGKDIDAGRISHLPDETIAPLFKDTIYDYSIAKEDPNINFELCNTKSYYLYGTQQTVNMITYAGALLSITHAMDMAYVDFIDICITHLKKFGFEILLQGDLINHFADTSDLIKVLKRTFIDTSVKIDMHPFDKWNELFMDMAKLYFQTVTLIFEDIGYNNVDFIIPPNIKRSGELIPENYKFIILLKKNFYYYPIYIIEPEKFFKSELIEKRVFQYKDGAISKIIHMVEFNLENEEKVHSSIDLNIVQDFVKTYSSKHGNYTFHKQFINSRNLIYGVLLKYNKTLIYVPVDFSYYSMTDVELDHVFLRKDYTLPISSLQQFISDYNEFILQMSMKRNLYSMEYMESSEQQKRKIKPQDRVIPYYPFINIELVIVSNGKQIGFISNGLTFYWSVGKINAPSTTLNYDPDYVNKAIGDHKELQCNDKRMEKLGKSLYEHNIYQITVMEFMTAFNRQKNTKIRNELIKLIKSTNFKSNLTPFIKQFNDILKDYPNDSSYIRTQINEFYNVHMDKSILIEHISGTFYDFDRIDLGANPKAKLKKIAMGFVKIGDPKVGAFPNIMVPCEDSDASYCVKRKLVIPAAKLDEIIDIFSEIIQNKYFETYIGYVAFMNNTRDYFNFEKRPNEEIDIQPYVI